MNDLLRRMLFLPDQASDYARQVDGLHYFVIITTMLAAAGVFATAIYFFVRYRRRADTDVTPRVEPKAIHEVIFVGLPLAFFLVWFAIGFPQFAKLQTPPKDAMDVYVQGKKWMWKFAYPGGPNSVDVLRVPAGRPVRLLITSRDVIHSFYVPALRVKQDALPGRYTQTWFNADRPGRYEIFCAEYCGLAHSGMIGELVVMPAEEFDQWLATQGRGVAGSQDGTPVPGEPVRPASNVIEEGRRLASEQGCLKCHSVDGTRHIGPTWVDLYERNEKLQSGKSVQADEGYLTKSMMDPAADIVAGYQNVMPTYQGKLAPPEAAAIVEFIKSLKTPAVQSGPSEGPVYESIPRK
ncbi:cytochrome c oxidase, subunit II [Anaeromyxobacter sp. K]|uniref:cytochrome-c oxidase n=1 Tax=Anaeromyxobacter dehalogenans (strain ATCC BAA-258 / DSM 21875 / 2CP-1) TaxID=455488 RepID=B8JDW2_ANAD2|nr:MULTISPECIES: cytochrome c oxidase subunit II [Anaeromyxobacter]ACG72087.1 cytochrome c oxidase, subunit II [Anaeromyxobacter sp. K]ACL64207.1 cytochrome c oxidase, subunit II [Anaeromyxobacter dehalogenans 2CP-1]